MFTVNPELWRQNIYKMSFSKPTDNGFGYNCRNPIEKLLRWRFINSLYVS